MGVASKRSIAWGIATSANRAGARLAGRIGDGWSAFDDNFEQHLPLYLESLEALGVVFLAQ